MNEKSTKKKRHYQILFYDPYCKGCGICSELCKRKALRIGDRLGPLGYFVAEVVDAELCNGCRFCEVSCPDMAITVMEEAR
jgi:2-oxoglutarate ferredoxin oxidoreductase subunit delta